MEQPVHLMQLLPRLICMGAKCIFWLRLMFTLIRNDKKMWRGNAYDGCFVRFRTTCCWNVDFLVVVRTAMFFPSLFSELLEPEVLQTSTQHKKFHHKPLWCGKVTINWKSLERKTSATSSGQLFFLHSTYSSKSFTVSVNFRFFFSRHHLPTSLPTRNCTGQVGVCISLLLAESDGHKLPNPFLPGDTVEQRYAPRWWELMVSE